MKALLPLLLLLLPALVWAQEPGLPTAEVVRQALQHPLMTGLQYWWLPLQGFTGGSVLFDQGPLRADMTLAGASGAQNGPQWANADRPGSYAHLTFDGTDDTAATSVTENPTPFAPYTVCAWAKATATMASEQHVLDAGDPTTAPYGQLTLAWTTGGNNLPAFFWYHNTVGIMGVVSTLDVGTGTWVHLCGVNDGSGSLAGMALYVNGASTSTSMAGSPSTWTGGTVGSNPWRLGQTAFNGAISEGMVWYRALSAPEVQALYQASQTGYQSLAPALLAQPYEQPAVVVGGAALPWFRFPLLGTQSRFAPGLEQDLVSWWRATPGLSEGAVWPDLLETGGDGTLVAMGYGPTSGWSGTDRPGGTAQMNFDGVDDYVTMGTASLYDFPNQTFSVALWVRATTSGYLIGRRLTGTDVQGGWFLRLNSDGTLTARIGNANNVAAADRTTTQVFTDGLWRQVTVIMTTDQTTGSGNDLHIYVNGLQDEGTLFSSPGGLPYTICGCALVLGALADQGAGGFLTGALDDVRLYNRGLSALEIATVVQQGALSVAGVAPATEVLSMGGLAPQGSFLPFFGR